MPNKKNGNYTKFPPQKTPKTSRVCSFYYPTSAISDRVCKPTLNFARLAIPKQKHLLPSHQLHRKRSRTGVSFFYSALFANPVIVILSTLFSSGSGYFLRLNYLFYSSKVPKAIIFSSKLHKFWPKWGGKGHLTAKKSGKSLKRGFLGWGDGGDWICDFRLSNCN